MDEWRLAKADPVGTPVAAKNDLDCIAKEKDEDMTHTEATKFRRADARLNHLALDRPDFGVAAGRLSRCTARPRVSDVQTEKGAQMFERATSKSLFLGSLSQWSWSS